MDITRRNIVKAGGFLLLSQGFGPRAIAEASQTNLVVDVLIYGGTASGVMAAYAAAREGARVAIVLAGPLGGMPAQGLSWSDTGNSRVIGGLARRFFLSVGAYYGKNYAVIAFEPFVARKVFHKFLNDAAVMIINGPYISAVHKENRQLTAIKLSDGSIVKAKVFVDATYEGDLMAMAQCSYRVGRESRVEFNEPLAGFDAFPLTRHRATRDAHGKRFAALLPYPGQERFSADRRIQAYTFRLCLSDDPANMRRFEPPPGYDADRYLYEISLLSSKSKFIAGATMNHKFDRNGNYFGASWGWPEGSRAQRKIILKDHYEYQAGLLYCYATDRRVPKNYRDQVNSYGLAKDEFVDSDNWPRQLYIREARRLRGHYIMKSIDCTTTPTKAHSIGMGSYSFDCHATAIFETGNGVLDYEGSFGSLDTSKTVPYEIPYECLLPLQYDNLLVSVCVSATHVAFSSMRMEPQYMIMGEAAGCAAGLIAKRAVRSVDVRANMTGLLKGYGAITSRPA